MGNFVGEVKLDIGNAVFSEENLKGISYSGKPVNYRGENIIIDLETVMFQKSTPVLESHNPSIRVGVINKFDKTQDGLEVSGKMLRNENAKRILSDSADGFPFQMSVFFESNDVRMIGENDGITINNFQFSGGYVMYNALVREVSLTPIGVDNSTSAVFFEKREKIMGDQAQKQEDNRVVKLSDELATAKLLLIDKDKELSDANAKIQALSLEVNSLKSDICQLKLASRKEKLKELFDVEKDENKSKLDIYLSMSDEAFSQVMADMPKTDSKSNLEVELAVAGNDQSFSTLWTNWSK